MKCMGTSETVAGEEGGGRRQWGEGANEQAERETGKSILCAMRYVKIIAGIKIYRMPKVRLGNLPHRAHVVCLWLFDIPYASRKSARPSLRKGYIWRMLTRETRIRILSYMKFKFKFTRVKICKISRIESFALWFIYFWEKMSNSRKNFCRVNLNKMM